MRILAPLLLLIFVAIGCVNPPKGARNEGKKKTGADKLNTTQLINVLNKMEYQKNWESVRLEKAERSMVVAYLDYKSAPNTIIDVNLSTKIIAKTIINEMQRQGVDPHDESISIFVHAQMPETSPTGRGVTRRYGKAIYEPFRDRLSFEEIK